MKSLLWLKNRKQNCTEKINKVERGIWPKLKLRKQFLRSCHNRSSCGRMYSSSRNPECICLNVHFYFDQASDADFVCATRNDCSSAQSSSTIYNEVRLICHSLNPTKLKRLEKKKNKSEGDIRVHTHVS